MGMSFIGLGKIKRSDFRKASRNLNFYSFKGPPGHHGEGKVWSFHISTMYSFYLLYTFFHPFCSPTSTNHPFKTPRFYFSRFSTWNPPPHSPPWSHSDPEKERFPAPRPVGEDPKHKAFQNSRRPLSERRWENTP